MAQNNIKLSIIVPAYNCQKYVLECLSSIKEQGLCNYECIVVDDGSTDNTASLCDGFAKSNPNFIVIHQANAGVSVARNKGIESATGDYITFVDSDDLVAPNAYKKAVETILREECDIYCFGLAFFVDEEQPRPYHFEQGALQSMFIKHPVYMNAVWNKVFRADLLRDNGIRFNSKIKTSEDFIVSFEALSLAKKTVYTNQPDYLYRQNPSSVTRNYEKVTTRRARSDENACVVSELRAFAKKNRVKASKIIRYRQLLDALYYVEEYDTFSLPDYKKYAHGINIWTFTGSARSFCLTFLMSFKLYFLVYLFHFLQGKKNKLKTMLEKKHDPSIFHHNN